jgi:hypothetical protein
VVYTALVANGTVSELYIQSPTGFDFRGEDYFIHVIPPMKGKKKNGIGRGEIGMLDWCAEEHSRKFLSSGDLGMNFH